MNCLRTAVCLIFGTLPLLGYSQVVDDFTDGDYTSNPTWTGIDSLFVIDAGELRSNKGDAATYYLSTPSTLALGVQWEFFVNLKFSTSGANYVDVYLMSDVGDLLTTANGYFVRIGNTKDEISLYEVVSGTSTMIIDGTDDVVSNSSSNPFNIRVKRDSSSAWTLEYDEGATGNYINGGSVVNSAVTTSSFFGIYIEQSSAASPKFNHFFDNFDVGLIPPDTVSPAVSSLVVVSDTTLDVLFDEVVEQTSAETALNYSADQGLNAPVSAVRDATDSSIVHLEFGSQFQNGITNTLTLNNISDNNGNAIAGNISETFMYFVAETPALYDVVIIEIFPDPIPAVGLPELEFVELYNNSTKILDLTGYTFSDGGTPVALTDKILLPGGYLILCDEDDVGAFQSFGDVMGLASFPGLNNDGDELILRSNAGILLHAVGYTASWYNNTFKDDGGWTLEMIDPSNPCAEESNWAACVNANGGTPGIQNSISSSNPDTEAPKLARADVLDTLNVLLTFNEPLDSQGVASVAYTISPAVIIVADSLLTSTTIKLTLAVNLTEQVVYTATITDAADCVGNVIGTDNSAEFALAEQGMSGDLIINEILSNPTTDGSDFVEVYNNSSRFINLNGWHLANWDNDTIDNFTPITTSAYVVFPGDYVLLTTSISDIESEYPLGDESAYLEVASMPSYNNDDGTVVLVNNLFAVSDSVTYNPDMHFSLLKDVDGVSLERLDFNRPAHDHTNWHSAAETVGFATPGYKNSQSNPADSSEGDVVVLPEIFSPDNDGIDDVVDINYSFESGGYVGSIFIYDAKGRLIKSVVQNELLGTKGTFSWDGTLENGEKGRLGIYVIYFEAFGILGEIKQFKRSCVLAGKL